MSCWNEIMAPLLLSKKEGTKRRGNKKGGILPLFLSTHSHQQAAARVGQLWLLKIRAKWTGSYNKGQREYINTALRNLHAVPSLNLNIHVTCRCRHAMSL